MAPKRRKVGGEESSSQAQPQDSDVHPDVPADTDAPAPPEAEIPERLTEFRSRDHKHRFRFDLIGRKMTSLYYLDLTAFDSTPGLEFVSWIRRAGLEPFVSFRDVGYLTVIREFYANLDLAYEGGAPVSLTSRVDGFDIELSIVDFRTMFQIPEAGAGICFRQGDLNFSDVYAGESIPLLGVFEDITINRTRPRVGKDKYPSGELRFQEYVAHRTFLKVLFPLLSSTDSLSFYQAFYLYALKHEVQVDFAAAIFAHMEYVVTHKVCGLPYGHIITRILRDYPVDFPATPITPSCGVTISSLHQMTIDFNAQFACWTWRGVQVTNLVNPIRDIPIAPPPPPPTTTTATEIPESSSTSHGSCAPWLKKIASMVRSSRRQARSEYERIKARQDEWYRLKKERHPETYSALYEDAASPPDPTAIWANEDDDDLGDVDMHDADDAIQSEDDDDPADA